jgi:hypothetical protein
VIQCQERYWREVLEQHGGPTARAALGVMENHVGFGLTDPLLKPFDWAAPDNGAALFASSPNRRTVQ